MLEGQVLAPSANSRCGWPAEKVGRVVTGTVIISPAAPSNRISRPLRDQRGAVPPPVEICQRPSAVRGNGRTYT